MLETHGGYMGKKTGSIQINRRDFLKLSAVTTTAAMGLTGMSGILEGAAGFPPEPRLSDTRENGAEDHGGQFRRDADP
jgi:hypothetical protein